MPYSIPIGALDSIERQIRRVRLRRNLHALQRAVYLSIATVAFSAALLLVLALMASTRVFAVAAWSLGATIAMTLVMVWWEARERWLRAPAVASWIDARAGLRGRLLTLTTVTRRRELANGPFVPLLLEQTMHERASWTPSRLVPRPVPLGALAGAVAATGALLLAIALGPRFQPHVPEIVYSNEPVDTELEGFDGVPDRVVVAPNARQQPQDDSLGAALPAPGEGEAERSPLASLPGALQARIRDQLWGDAWSRVREQLARAERDASGERDGSSFQDGDAGATGDADDAGDQDDAEAWDDAGLPPDLRGTTGRDRRRAGASTRADATRGGAARRAQSTADDTAEDDPSAGAAGSGSGGGTDPNLYGTASNSDSATGNTFELGIAARVRGRRGAPGPVPGEAPPADPDAKPELASGQRAETAVHHMAVPAAYEALVREVFAHRDSGPGGAP